MDRVAAAQALGRREQQEDAVRIVRQSESDPGSDLLLLLADGMGGHAGGEVASRLAIEAFVHHFETESTNPRPGARLSEALDAANAALARRVAAEPALTGMGSTMIGVLATGGRLLWVSVGDSPLYLLRAGRLQRLNADHSLHGELLEMVERGDLAREEADAHPQRNALRSALTGEEITLRDRGRIELDPGDLVVLASDGLDTLEPARIGEIAQEAVRGPAQGVCDALLAGVAEADRPRQDNTSVIVLRHGDGTGGTVSRDSRWQFGPRHRSPRAAGIASVAGVAALALLGAVYLGQRGDAPDPHEPGGEVRASGPTDIDGGADPHGASPPPDAAASAPEASGGSAPIEPPRDGNTGDGTIGDGPDAPPAEDIPAEPDPPGDDGGQAPSGNGARAIPSEPAGSEAS